MGSSEWVNCSGRLSWGAPGFLKREAHSLAEPAGSLQFRLRGGLVFHLQFESRMHNSVSVLISYWIEPMRSLDSAIRDRVSAIRDRVSAMSGSYAVLQIRGLVLQNRGFSLAEFNKI